MTVAEARKVMDGLSKKYSDEQIEEMLDLFYAMSNLIIDEYVQAKNNQESVCEDKGDIAHT